MSRFTLGYSSITAQNRAAALIQQAPTTQAHGESSAIQLISDIGAVSK